MSLSLLSRRAVAPDAARLVHPAFGQCAEVLSEAVLASVAEGLVSALPIVDAPVPTRWGRAYRQLLRTDDYEAWVIAWSPGSVLELHDHGESAAAVHVVAGRLVERLVDRRCGLARQRIVRAGSTVTIPRHFAHEVHNRGLVDAVSIHVYSPRLERMTFFDSVETGGLRPIKTERYDPLDSWGEW